MTEDNYLDWLRGFTHDDNHKAAEDALNDLGRLNQRARTLLLPVLSEAVLMSRRNLARGVERSHPVREVFGGESTIERRQSLLEASFVIGDGRRVTWSEATEPDHLARIEYLRLHVAGLERTISEHEAAIETIRLHGVSCLGEIEVAS